MRGSRWTKYEDSLLRDLASKSYNHAEMSPLIGRTSSSIIARTRKLGIKVNARGKAFALPQGDRTKWNRAERLCAFADVPIRLAEYVVQVADIRGIELAELRSESRADKLVKIRGSIATEARNNGFSLSAIGRALNRDHTTVIHALKSMAA